MLSERLATPRDIGNGLGARWIPNPNTIYFRRNTESEATDSIVDCNEDDWLSIGDAVSDEGGTIIHRGRSQLKSTPEDPEKNRKFRS